MPESAALKIKHKVKTLLRRSDGPLTRELVQSPGNFGLGKIPAGIKPDRTTSMICGFCSTGCGLKIHLQQGQAVSLSPDPEYPVNRGMACPKGWEALAPLHAPDRGTTPLLRNARGVFEVIGWAQAMTVFTERFKSIQARHGPESIAWLGTGQIVNEELAFLGALAKFGMGMIHGDGNTRQCMATAVTAYKESFGFDAPPFTYQDFEESDVLVFVGANPCIAHPILWQRVLSNPHQPTIIVIDPRKTETALTATQHYAIQPKSDLILFYCLANILIRNDWLDDAFISAHTSGFAEFSHHLAAFTPESMASCCGLSVSEIHKLAETIHSGKRVSFWWTMGVNQGHEATRTAQAIINLALMTGNIGRPGTGANSITGQCNAMGSRLFSNTTNLLGGHDFLNPAHRQKVARILGIDTTRIPARNSYAYDQILDAVDRGEIKGLWIIATNTSHSWIDQSAAVRILKKLDFLVVQDMYHTTETAQHAHLFLPAAGWGEKEGTFINSERRIGLVKAISKAPGMALSDFNIFKLVAHYWGCQDLFRQWESPEAVFKILAALTRGQPCDITGISDYRMIDEANGIQWPLPAGEALVNPHRRLFENGVFYHPDGKGRFLFAQPHSTPEPPDENYPFILLTGRGTSAQWHTQTRTGKSEILRKLYPAEPYVEINPVDAQTLGIGPHKKVIVTSRRGQIKAVARLTEAVQPGQIFIPMHYARVNQLTFPAFDPLSRQPSYKHCAVNVRLAHAMV